MQPGEYYKVCIKLLLRKPFNYSFLLKFIMFMPSFIYYL
jgi:hypothetical protein